MRKISIRFCNNIRHFTNEINKRGGWITFCGGWNFSKLVSVGSTFIREMRVVTQRKLLYYRGQNCSVAQDRNTYNIWFKFWEK